MRHGHTLDQTDPFEGRADIRQQIKAGSSVVLGNAPTQTVDSALKRFIGIAHEGDDRPVALANVLRL